MVLKRDEAKLILELKAAAKQGNQQSVQVSRRLLLSLFHEQAMHQTNHLSSSTLE